MANKRIKSSVRVDEKGTHLTVTCKECGEPISQSNEWGMFCKNLCGLDKSKEAQKTIDKYLNQLFGGIPGGLDGLKKK